MMVFETHQWYDSRLGHEVSLHYGTVAYFLPRECHPMELARYLRDFADSIEQEAAEVLN